MKKHNSNITIQFFLGILLMGAGLFMLTNQVTVSSSWYSWGFLRLGGHDFSTGVVVFPLLVGIVMLFYNPKWMFAKIIIVLGALFIVLTIIMGISLHFRSTSLFTYIIIVGLIAAGGGLLLKTMFSKKDSD